ncbi:hypothetical protein DET56_11929 [Paenibacillus pabuli]|uniref:Uncharacterized protein n=1 Tax=Paenibacillus pabuli TaxID=1472 RepID=A0A855XP29_9BACL|nr:hypothetical protein DET56_11929 [Paenibacillus pabuli]PXW08465.1 hypothetical protein DEU73_104431 [Paenibacillus taichungensis]
MRTFHFFRPFLSPPPTWRYSSNLYGSWYLSIDKNIRLEGWIKIHYKPDLILYSSCGNIGDKLAADEQEHHDQRNNSQ